LYLRKVKRENGRGLRSCCRAYKISLQALQFICKMFLEQGLARAPN